MFLAAIIPAVSAIVMSFTRFAGADLSIMPCSMTDKPNFTITDFTGGISQYTGGESFTFYLQSNFDDYHSGCSGDINKGADDSGMQWCSTRIPGWNVSYIMTHDHNVLFGHAFLCSQEDGTVVNARAEAAATLKINVSDSGKLSMDGKNATFPASMKTL
ncbi:hypothetical protein F5Y19DRAFT_465923 [Xylariaceae sp. FL1651]|nr:hypothetical protein F5Y19DRAFT_465923 [Xylariaceae sp. FL1651]